MLISFSASFAVALSPSLSRYFACLPGTYRGHPGGAGCGCWPVVPAFRRAPTKGGGRSCTVGVLFITKQTTSTPQTRDHFNLIMQFGKCLWQCAKGGLGMDVLYKLKIPPPPPPADKGKAATASRAMYLGATLPCWPLGFFFGVPGLAWVFFLGQKSGRRGQCACGFYLCAGSSPGCAEGRREGAQKAPNT